MRSVAGKTGLATGDEIVTLRPAPAVAIDSEVMAALFTGMETLMFKVMMAPAAGGWNIMARLKKQGRLR